MKTIKRRVLSLLLAAALCAALLPWTVVPAEAASTVDTVALLSSVTYYGDRSKCQMTAEQADAYVEVLESEIAAARREYDSYDDWYYYDSSFHCYAALIDFGDGVPALYFVGGATMEGSTSITWDHVVCNGLWEYKNGAAVAVSIPIGYEDMAGGYTIYRDHLISYVNGPKIGGTEQKMYPITNGVISASPSTSALDNMIQDWRVIDGQHVFDDQFFAWPGDQWSKEVFVSFEYGNNGREGFITGVGPVEPVLDALRTFKLQNATPEEILNSIPYHYGNASTCRMTPEQALALAETIERHIVDDKAVHNSRFPNNLDEYGDEMLFGGYAALFDTGTGIPSVFYVSGNFSDMGYRIYGENIYGPGLRGTIDDSALGGPAIFQYINGNVEEAAAVGYIYKDRLVSANGGAWERIAIYPYINGIISSTASTTGYVDPGDSYYEIDGRQVSGEEYGRWRAKWYGDGDAPVGCFYGGGVGYNFWGVVPAETVAAVLRAYAEVAVFPVYTYPQADESDTHYRDVTQAVSGRGTVQTVYRLLEDLYYVLLENQGAYTGAVVRGVTRSGQPAWEVYQTDAEPAGESVLEALLNRLLSSSNLTLDFGKLRGSPTVGDLADYLRELLQNYDGLSPNDAAKTELATFLDSAVSAVASGSVSGKDNRLTLDSALVSALAGAAKSAWADLLAVINSAGVTLNKTVTPRARLLWQDVDPNQACQLTVDKSLVSGLNGADLQVLLGSGDRYIQLSDQSLRRLADELETFSVQFSRTGNNTYSINFLDKDGQVLDSLPSPITLGLPAPSMTSTVMVSYAGGSDNWGGQYDGASGVLAFETRYSGQYEVLENNIQIDDITDLSEESQAAIRFMVSKGYLTLDESGLFNPQLPMTRYDFTRTLVSMFFALDRSLSTTFTDVPGSSEYYDYVASAEANQLIQGIEETLFGGEEDLVTEQMLTITGRTLAERKGYALPRDAEQYLSAFGDGSAVSDWAQLHTALSVREGLWDRGGMLYPQSEVTREQAAVTLYRLFLRLYEVPPVALDLPPQSEAAEPEPGNDRLAIIGAAAAGAAVVLVGAGAAVVIRKKRKADAPKEL